MDDDADGALIRLQRYLGVPLKVLLAAQWRCLADQGGACTLARLAADPPGERDDGVERGGQPEPGS